MKDIKKHIGNSAVLCFSNSNGGMEYDAARLVQNINEHITQCYMVTRTSSWLAEYASLHNIPHIAIDFKGTVSIKGSLTMHNIWKSKGIRNIIFFGSSEMPSIFTSISSQIKSFIVRHGTTKSSSKRDILHNITWSRVNAHWCISKHIENNVKEIFPLRHSTTFVNYVSLGEKVGVIKEAAPLSESDTLFRIAHVGRFVKGKGQRDAITIVNNLLLRNIPAHLTLYGEGEDEYFLRSMVREMGLLEHVYFAGHVESPYREFDRYHAFLFPSYGEGLGNAFIEALASGMHCFCYENTVFPELKETGLKFTMATDRNIEELASSMSSTWGSRLDRPFENIRLCRKIFSVAGEMNELIKHLK